MTHPSELTFKTATDDFESQLKPLWLRGNQGDSLAYKAALQLIAARLRRFYIRRLLNMPDDVEDLVQETLLALHLQRASYDNSLPVSSWVYSIARHKLVDLWRRRGRKESLNDSFDELDESKHPIADTEMTAARDLNVLLNRLPEAQQQAILLIKIEGLTMEEASARSGVSVAALKVQVHRALKKLADMVRSES